MNIAEVRVCQQRRGMHAVCEGFLLIEMCAYGFIRGLPGGGKCPQVAYAKCLPPVLSIFCPPHAQARQEALFWASA